MTHLRRAPIPMGLTRLSSSLALLALLGCGAQASGDPPEMVGAATSPGRQASATQLGPRSGQAWVVFGADTVVAEVASTDAERASGLMFREDVPDGTGMLFVFPEAAVRSFWMQDTYVALDIAFMGADFRIVDIQQMEPLTLDSHESTGPAMYALEVRKGWYEEHQIGVGATPEIRFGG